MKEMAPSNKLKVQAEFDILLCADGVTKVFGTTSTHVVAVNQVSLRVRRGEFLAIMGPSGCGKTTLLNILGCLDKPTWGVVSLNGINTGRLNSNQLADLRNREVGFVFQMYNLIPRLTALENVLLPLVLDERRRVDRRQAISLMEQLGLKHRLDHRPGELSGGEQQRVAIARALVNDPSLIIADEPTGNLDSTAGQDVMSLLAWLNQLGKTLIIATHSKDVACRAHRIVYLEDGILKGEEWLPYGSQSKAPIAIDEESLLETKSESNTVSQHSTQTSSVDRPGLAPLDTDLSRGQGEQVLLVTTTGQTYPLKMGLNTIGRDQGNDIVLNDGAMSRQHAELHREKDFCTVVDLGSTNGTFLDGQRLVPHQSQPVSEGARLCFGPSMVAILIRDGVHSAETHISPRSPHPSPSTPDHRTNGLAPVSSSKTVNPKLRRGVSKWVWVLILLLTALVVFLLSAVAYLWLK